MLNLTSFKDSLLQKPFIKVIYNAFKHIKDGDLLLIVYALSFVTILSFVPFVIVTLGLFKTTGFLKFLYPKMEILIVKNFSGVVSAEISKYLQTLLKRSYSGSWGILNITFLALTTMRLAAYVEKAINRIWKVSNPQGFFNRFITHWLLIIMVPIALSLNILTRSVISQWIKSPVFFLILSFTFLALTLFALYKWLPNQKVQNSLAVFCGFLAAGALVLVHRFFDFATIKIFNYSKFYGSLAALPLFMIWISTIWLVVLMGAAICAGLQKALEQISDN